MTAAIPSIEITDDTNALSIGRPDSKSRALNAINLAQVRAEALEGAQVRAFGKQPDVKLAEHRGESIGVFDFLDAARPGNAQAIVERLVATENRAFKEA